MSENYVIPEDPSSLLVKDDLIDRAPEDFTVGREHSRREALETVLPDSAYVDGEFVGRYQGRCAFVVGCDGYVWVYFDYYGSCSYCDGFIQRETEWTENALREALCFETVDDAHQYVEFKQGQESYIHDNVYPGAHEMLEDLRRER